jgi:hypothetical protein
MGDGDGDETEAAVRAAQAWPRVCLILRILRILRFMVKTMEADTAAKMGTKSAPRGRKWKTTSKMSTQMIQFDRRIKRHSSR